MFESELDRSKPFTPLAIAVLAVSDTRTLETDTAGALLKSLLEGDGHRCVARAMCRDDIQQIRAQVMAWVADSAIDAILTTGGTGFSGRDVTPEAIQPLFEKTIDGFEVVWHMTSFQSVGLSTMQSRACAGLAKGTLIFALPGSNGACKDGWDRLIRWQLDNRLKPCNLAELIPRFTEV